MKKNILLIFVLTLILNSCGVPQKDFDKIQSELKETKNKLAKCSSELLDIKNTPEQRIIRAKKFFANNKLLKAKNEYQGIINNYKGIDEVNIAQKEIVKINQIIKKKQIAEERKKALGFKILKPTSNVKLKNISLRIEKIWFGKNWIFNAYDDEYRYSSAERGSKYVLARISISSKINNPSLPPILVYQLINGKLHLLGTLQYRFRRWENYGSYLGNYTDYGNSFAHSKTIPFNLGLELSNKHLKNKVIFIVLKKTNCFIRHYEEFHTPQIKYIKKGCKPKKILKVKDFDKNYVLLKIFNKSKI